MDFNTSLRRAMKTGTVTLGRNSTETSIKDATARLVIIAQNCPEDFKKFVEGQENLAVYPYKGSGRQLGRECGKDFIVSALAVIEPGESDILTLQRA
ncbi:50S ribosomal protein L30 [Methanocalculus chunghsingensis]|uniref:50S ribosomal protein L30 n=1 Tax=Methanocalculus chunghsingensis TaxID=156457 RepID=A0A8J7W578_9EURY|nr:50S ribosomal protein L30e [Methanocalculus chunghsingensis]MBR1367971.1 50S ribosomal protein L30 [Methanocalculus chunghsingensis]